MKSTMKNKRLLITLILALAFPISNHASAGAGSHCQTPDGSPHAMPMPMPMPMQMGDQQHGHEYDRTAAEAADSRNSCPCDCADHTGCLTQGFSAIALSNVAGMGSGHLIQPFYPEVETLVVSSPPHLFFRPPIALS